MKPGTIDNIFDAVKLGAKILSVTFIIPVHILHKLIDPLE
jgi:hypothetical protein